jgi:uncharacterized membrane protein YccF (DUF307 family)
MILAANIIWFVFGGGFFAWLSWLICGAILCCTVVGIPFGIAAFRIAGFSAFPFGKELVDARDLGEERITGTGLANLLWIILAGIWLAIGHIVAGIGCFLSFILIFPIFFGIAHFKLVNVCFSPLGKRVMYRD